MGRTVFFLPTIVIAIALALSAIYVVDEREKALVLQFGQIVNVKEDPGVSVALIRFKKNLNKTCGLNWISATKFGCFVRTINMR